VATLTLKQLKEENATEEEVKQDLPVEDIKEDVKGEEIKIDDSIVAANEEAEPTEDGGEEKSEVESWMQTEDTETSEDDHKPGFVPNHEAAKRRKQAQALKGDLKEAKSENEELLARIAKLEGGNAPVMQQQEQSNQLPPRPTREQFDFDDDAYDTAIDDWNDKKFDLKLNTHYQTNNQKQQESTQAQAQQVALTKSIDDHYDRAAKLVSDGKVSEESYKNADKIVRLSMDNLNKGHGDEITNVLISTLDSAGEGSEKVMYQLGVNPLKLQELQNRLISDPTGITAAVYLGQLQSQIQMPGKRRSQAPAPGEKVEGEGGGGGPAGSMQKQYAKSDNPSFRVSLKRKAKASGVDVTNW
jgi:hypothetical protein